MFFEVLFLLPMLIVGSQENGRDIQRPYVVFPVPMEMPNRNDRSEQCWLRIEDMDLTETITIYCYMATAFLREQFYEYNKKKSENEGIDLHDWNPEPKTLENNPGSKALEYYQDSVRDWKTTTVVDTTTHIRLFVTLKADCRIVIYSREGMTNFRVDCAKILYFLNDKMGSASIVSRASLVMSAVSVFIVLHIVG